MTTTLGKDRQMSVPSEQPTSGGTDAQDYDDTYYRSHGGSDEPYDWASPHWRTFFTMVAERVIGGYQSELGTRRWLRPRAAGSSVLRAGR